MIMKNGLEVLVGDIWNIAPFSGNIIPSLGFSLKAVLPELVILHCYFWFTVDTLSVCARLLFNEDQQTEFLYL